MREVKEQLDLLNPFQYHDLKRGQWGVYCRGTRIGVIHYRSGKLKDGKVGWQFIPENEKVGGEVFATIELCKSDIERKTAIITFECKTQIKGQCAEFLVIDDPIDPSSHEQSK